MNVIQGYGNRNTYRLQKFLKSLRVRITHITRKNSRGQPRPRIRPIYGLANRGDGGSSPNAPKVSRHGAGPQDVQFFLAESSPQPVVVPGAPESKGNKGKKGKKAPTAGPAEAGRYITVADFFKKGPSIFDFLSLLLLLPSSSFYADFPLRIQHGFECKPPSGECRVS